MKLLAVLVALCAALAPAWAANKVVCYYDSRAYWREGKRCTDPRQGGCNRSPQSLLRVLQTFNGVACEGVYDRSNVL